MAQILVQWPGNRPKLNRCPGAPTSRGMRSIAWRLYLGTGALATGAYYLLPEAGGAVLNVVVGASAVAAIATVIRWHRPARWPA